MLYSDAVRYHIKLAAAQWLGSLVEPTLEELTILLPLDRSSGQLPLLLRSAFLSTAGWFDLLCAQGQLRRWLFDADSPRSETALWWLTRIASERPLQVVQLLRDWWSADEKRSKRLLEWLGSLQAGAIGAEIADFCSEVLRSNPAGLFDRGPTDSADLLFHAVVTAQAGAPAAVLKTFYDVWFNSHPGAHPFDEADSRGSTHYWLGELAKNRPQEFLDGTVDALSRSVAVIVERVRDGERDYSFKHRTYSGHHFRSDAFLNLFRGALRAVARADPQKAISYLVQMDPTVHEVFTHLWLETIKENPSGLHRLIPELLKLQILFDAGWEGARWRSFADAAAAVMPYLAPELRLLLEARILSRYPELDLAKKITKTIKAEGEQGPWWTKRSVIHDLNQSGYEQWCVLQTIGEPLLSRLGRERLTELSRKFKNQEPAKPHHNEAQFVPSPIKRDNAARMTDDQWLRAMARYADDNMSRSRRGFLEGGAEQLAGELQQLVKSQPMRFARLLESVPDSAHPTYVARILWGLAEAEEIDARVVGMAIVNAHRRPKSPYGAEIARLFECKPELGSDPDLLQILLWYVEFGEAEEREEIDTSHAEREVLSIDDLVQSAGRIHVRGVNGARGWATEALERVLWAVPDTAASIWPLLERRATLEHLTSVRCCLLRPLLPLYNVDRQRCALLVEAIVSRSGRNRIESIVQGLWKLFVFHSSKYVPHLRALMVSCGVWLEEVGSRQIDRAAVTKRLSPLLANQGVHLFIYLLYGAPAIAQRLLFDLLRGDETARAIGGWHILRRWFQDEQYAERARAFQREGVTFRRFTAALAAEAITEEEFFDQARTVLAQLFDDEDETVRRAAAGVFRRGSPQEFERYRGLADAYLNSRAFYDEAFSFFHALGEAQCKVDDIVVIASEKLAADIEANGSRAGRRSMELHELQDILKREYSASESNPNLRRRLLDIIDKLLQLEVYGIDTVIKAHERE